MAGSLDSQEAVEPVVLTKSVGTAYLMNLMSATQNGGGVDSARLSADAIAAQRGNRAARARLFAAIRRARPLGLTPVPRVTVGLPGRRSAAEGRPQRRPGRSGLRARSPDPDPEPALTARQLQAARVVVCARLGAVRIGGCAWLTAGRTVCCCWSAVAVKVSRESVRAGFGSVVEMPVARLRPWSGNPRRIVRERLDDLKLAMVADRGMLWARPILALPDGTVICGNMRLLAALELGWETLPVLIVDLDPERARIWALRDNQAYGEWDQPALAELPARCWPASRSRDRTSTRSSEPTSAALAVKFWSNADRR